LRRPKLYKGVVEPHKKKKYTPTVLPTALHYTTPHYTILYYNIVC
jgi:hypothetical protein